MSLKSFFEKIGARLTGTPRAHSVSDETFGTHKYWFEWKTHVNGQTKTFEYYKRAWAEEGRRGWDVHDNGVNPNNPILRKIISENLVGPLAQINFGATRLLNVSLPYEDALDRLKQIEIEYETEATNPPEGVNFLRIEIVSDHFSAAHFNPTTTKPLKTTRTALKSAL